jgi:hypothetical protein
MRRLIGVVSAGVLAAALCCAVSRATEPTFQLPAVDLGAQLAQRVFGETTAPAPSTESFLDEHVFRVSLSAAVSPTLTYNAVSLPALASHLFTVPEAPVSLVHVTPPSYVTPSVNSIESGFVQAPEPTPFVGDYQGKQPVRVTSSTVSPLLTFSGTLAAPQGGSVVVPGRLGKLQFSTHAETAQSQTLGTSPVADRAVGAGTTLNFRAGQRTLGVDFSSSVEQMNLGATPTLNVTDVLPAFVPSYADVNKVSLSAGVTVPISQHWTGSFQVDQQHLLGGYGMPGVTNLDANNTVYGARVTFQLPKSSSAISLTAQQFHYQDNLVPANAFVQTSANVDFTIKF